MNVSSPRRSVVAIVAALVWIALAGIDGRWGHPYSLRWLELPLALIVAWNRGAIWGAIAAAFAGCGWAVVRYWVGGSESVPALIWEAVVRFGTASFIVVTVDWLRSREHEQRLIAERDELTQLLNRRGFLHAAEAAFKSSSLAQDALGVLLIDVDGLKRINDTLGHSAGDAAIQRVAEAIRSGVRHSDLAARWGGDEFAVLLLRADAAAAAMVAERIRSRLASSDPRSTTPMFPVSFSVGSATSRGGTIAELLAEADRELRRAKDQKRAVSDRPHSL